MTMLGGEKGVCVAESKANFGQPCNQRDSWTMPDAREDSARPAFVTLNEPRSAPLLQWVVRGGWCFGFFRCELMCVGFSLEALYTGLDSMPPALGS